MSEALKGKPVTNFVKPANVPDLKKPSSGIADVTAAYIPEMKKVSIKWTSLGEKMGYQLYRKGANEAEAKMIVQTPMAQVDDTTINSGETYQYYVIPIQLDTNTTGAKSNVVSIEIPKDTALPSGSPVPSPLVSPSPSPGNGNEPVPSPSPSENLSLRQI